MFTSFSRIPSRLIHLASGCRCRRLYLARAQHAVSIVYIQVRHTIRGYNKAINDTQCVCSLLFSFSWCATLRTACRRVGASRRTLRSGRIFARSATPCPARGPRCTPRSPRWPCLPARSRCPPAGRARKRMCMVERCGCGVWWQRLRFRENCKPNQYLCKQSKRRRALLTVATKGPLTRAASVLVPVCPERSCASYPAKRAPGHFSAR